MSRESMQLTGRKALITGAASGIGRATARLLGRQGAAVAIVDIDAEGAETVAAEITERGGEAMAIATDVANADDCRRAVARTLESFDRLDILCNNAGIIRRATVVDTEEEDWDRLMAVNVKSIYLMSRLAIPAMIAGGGGVIVNTGSGWGLAAGPKAAAYCAAKAAVVQLTRAMAIDHGEDGIRVNCVCPGDTDTPLLRHEAADLDLELEPFLQRSAARPLGRIGRSEEIAEAILYLACDRSSYVTGSVLVVDGGGLAGSST